MKLNDPQFPQFTELGAGDRVLIVRADGVVGLADKSLLSSGSSGGGGEEPPPEPTVLSPYIASQSSVYSNIAELGGTYEKLNDADSTTGAGTNSGANFIRAAFPGLVTVSAVSVGGGNLPSWGAVAAYLNGAKLQYSNDAQTWTDILTISGVADSGENQIQKFVFPAPIQAQYFQLQLNNYLSTTLFKFE